MTASSRRHTVLVVDDSAFMRKLITEIVDASDEFRVVGTARNGFDALTQIHALDPAIVTLDLEMPELDGVSATEAILATRTVPVVLLTRHARPGVLRRALTAGARAFVPKTTPADRLARILRDVHAGGRYVDSEIAATALTEGTCPLSDRELDLLRHVHAGRSASAIAEVAHLAPGTVRNYLSSAMAKLNAPTRADAARIAYEEGWI